MNKVNDQSKMYSVEKAQPVDGEQHPMPTLNAMLVRALGIWCIIGGSSYIILGSVGQFAYDMEKLSSHHYWTAPLYISVGGLAVAFSTQGCMNKMAMAVSIQASICMGFYIAVLASVIIQLVDTTGDKGREHYDQQIAICSVLLVIGTIDFLCVAALCVIGNRFYHGMRKHYGHTGGCCNRSCNN